MTGYWNADSDRDWQDQCGMYDEPEEEGENDDMEHLEYARPGYLFMRVHTPQVFEEYLIPLHGDMSAAERRNYERLQHLAEMHRTSICGATFRAG